MQLNTSTHSRNPYKYTTILLLATLILVETVFTGINPENAWILLALVIFSSMVFIGDYEYVFIATTGASIITSLSGNPLVVLLALITALWGFIILYRFSRVDIVKTLLVTLFAYSPLCIINPYSLIPVSTVVLSFTLAVFRENMRIGRSSVEVKQLDKTVYIGENVKYIVSIKCPGNYKYTIIHGEKEVLKDEGVNDIELELSLKPGNIGFNESQVKVEVSDIRGLAKTVHGPYRITYTVLVKSTYVIRLAEKILMEYTKYISIPRILKVEVGIGGFGDIGIGGSVLRESSTLQDRVQVWIEQPGSGLSVSSGEKSVPGVGVPPHKTPSETPTLEKQTTSRTHVAMQIIREVEEYITKLIERSYTGEYIGIREYTPGDNPRFIHWKKISRLENQDELYIKLYGKGSSKKSSGRGEKIILVDLTTTSPQELDLLITTVYSDLITRVKEGTGLTTTHLFIKIPGKEFYYINGKTIDVLAALNTIVQKHSIRSLFDYQTHGRTRIMKIGEARGFIRELEDYYRGLGLGLIELFKSHASGVKNVSLIHSNALAYKYGVISSVLKDSGFYVVSLKK